MWWRKVVGMGGVPAVTWPAWQFGGVVTASDYSNVSISGSNFTENSAKVSDDGVGKVGWWGLGYRCPQSGSYRIWFRPVGYMFPPKKITINGLPCRLQVEVLSPLSDINLR